MRKINMLIKTRSLEDKIGHMIEVNMCFDHKKADTKKLIYNKLYYYYCYFYCCYHYYCYYHCYFYYLFFWYRISPLSGEKNAFDI